MSLRPNSLSRFIVVPQKVLDTELKKSFAHFNEGRIPVSVLGQTDVPVCPLPLPRAAVVMCVCVALQRWCWRHPRGSDLLRMASFQNNIYHEKDDIRCVCVINQPCDHVTEVFLPCRNLEMILFGCQSSLCVVVELGDELPSPADVQLAHARLRALCLGGESDGGRRSEEIRAQIEKVWARSSQPSDINSHVDTPDDGSVGADRAQAHLQPPPCP